MLEISMSLSDLPFGLLLTEELGYITTIDDTAARRNPTRVRCLGEFAVRTHADLCDGGLGIGSLAVHRAAPGILDGTAPGVSALDVHSPRLETSHVHGALRCSIGETDLVVLKRLDGL